MKAWFAEACDHENRHIFPTDLEPALGHCFRKSQAINTLLQLIKLLSVSLSPHVRTAVHVGTFFFSSNTETRSACFLSRKPLDKFHLTRLLALGASDPSREEKNPPLTARSSAASSWGSHLLCRDTWPRYDEEYGRDTFSPNVCSGTREIPPHF